MLKVIWKNLSKCVNGWYQVKPIDSLDLEQCEGLLDSLFNQSISQIIHYNAVVEFFRSIHWFNFLYLATVMGLQSPLILCTLYFCTLLTYLLLPVTVWVGIGWWRVPMSISTVPLNTLWLLWPRAYGKSSEKQTPTSGPQWVTCYQSAGSFCSIMLL